MMLDNNDEEIITIGELCEWLKIGETNAYRLLRSGQLKAFKINRVYKISRGAVKRFIREQEAG